MKLCPITDVWSKAPSTGYTSEMSSSGTLNELTEPLLLLDMQKYSSALVIYTQSRQPFYQQAHYSESNSTAPSYITKAQASDRRMRMAAFTVCRGWMHFIYQWLHWCNSGIASFFFFTKTLFQITVRGRHNMDDRLDYETFHLLKTVFFFFFVLWTHKWTFLCFRLQS